MRVVTQSGFILLPSLKKTKVPLITHGFCAEKVACHLFNVVSAWKSCWQTGHKLALLNVANSRPYANEILYTK